MMQFKTSLLATLLLLLFQGAVFASPARIRDLTIHEGDIARRIVGYGIVTGLEGTGDRSFGGISSNNPSVHSVVNLLRRFDIEVPPNYLRLRNVAAVLVTAEVSPYLRAGGRFEVQVSALGDATSIEGGVLWITPLVDDPNQPPVATAQGKLLVTRGDQGRYVTYRRQGNSARIPDGGVLEVSPPPIANAGRLLLKRPDRSVAMQIEAAINQAFGDSTAMIEDPGAIRLNLPAGSGFAEAAAIDTLLVDAQGPSRVIIHSREGTVVAGGGVRVGSAVIHHRGLTLRIGGGETIAGQGPNEVGLVALPEETLVQDIAAGLHVAGAQPGEIASIFEALRDSGALQAEVIIR
ncbi:MAG: flagellar basal body P-ring protein FlgI [Candidatus Eisenbacteria bacterium]|uniref:Flagellar P-ring protein n=1 Tax=Eiseniibacteriota bacterium TaxID=2212470 RepID=A0A7Y2E9K0_UNCEI|nr:flagellar basal body P-ring protein FlgI [Candidatus Eisenbacteria bacterium]